MLSQLVYDTQENMRRRLAIVTGILGKYPLGGLSWVYLQYMLGLKALGWDVFYYEELGDGALDPYEGTPSLRINLKYVAEEMARFGFSHRWLIRVVKVKGGYYVNGTPKSAENVLQGCDLFLNVSGSVSLSRLNIPGAKVYVDTDPVFTQGSYHHPNGLFKEELMRHQAHFTYGWNVGRENFPIPSGIIRWKSTYPPCCMEMWENDTLLPDGTGAFTTVSNWHSYGSVAHKGRKYLGRKDSQFKKFKTVPRRTGKDFEVALLFHPRYFLDVLRFERNGWRMVDARVASVNTETFKEYIAGSKAEFSVAKHGYVAGKSGWFSDKSIYYLASGKPVILQDTGFSNFLPTGKGLFAFSSVEGAKDAVDRVCRDYSIHSRMAVRIARQHFEARSVLTSLLRRM